MAGAQSHDTYPEAYLEYLVLFHADRDYFECHEVMEEFWKEQRESELAAVWLGLIQIAVAQYHERRGNFAGALKMLAGSLQNLRADHLTRLGIAKQLLADLRRRREAVAAKLANHDRNIAAEAFCDFNLPLDDPELVQLCQQRCRLAGKVWLAPGEAATRGIVDKHLLRDRTAVVEARAAELALRKQRRGHPE